jgi:hypothetical protein
MAKAATDPSVLRRPTVHPKPFSQPSSPSIEYRAAPEDAHRNGARLDAAAFREFRCLGLVCPRTRSRPSPGGADGGRPSDAGPDGQMGRFAKPCQDSQFVNIHAGLVVKENATR